MPPRNRYQVHTRYQVPGIRWVCYLVRIIHVLEMTEANGTPQPGLLVFHPFGITRTNVIQDQNYLEIVSHRIKLAGNITPV